jgi:hypothetical protein
MAEEIVSREDTRAALAARRELGEDFDDALVESFAQRIEQRLKAPPPAKRTTDDKGMSLALALVSIGCGIPITAIALNLGGVPALAIVWAGIVFVNVWFARLR